MARFSIIETPQNMPFFDGVVGGGCKNMPDFAWGMTFFWRGVLKIEGGEYMIFASKMYQIFHDFISTKKNIFFLLILKKKKNRLCFFQKKKPLLFLSNISSFFTQKLGFFPKKMYPTFGIKINF